MTLEHVKKPQVNAGLEPVKPKQSSEPGTPKRARVSATPTQLQRAKAKLEQQKTELQRQSDSLQPMLETRAAVLEQTRIQRLQDQIATREQHAKVQHFAEAQARQQTFFSSFVKSAVQRKSLEATKNSSIQASDARDQYQTAIVPEIMQRLVDDRMTLQSQVARVNQIPNALSTKTEWFNSQLPLLRARHNNPASPFRDSPTVYQPTDHQALSLGRVYSLQRLSSGLTPKDAASAILGIQRKADRDTALLGLLSGINPRQSDHASIQRLVSQGEHDFELQRHALLEDAGLQSQALQLATSQANPREANSGISEQIKQKLGGGFPLPENIRHQLEAGLNFDFSGVRLHTDNDADKLAKSVNALAFTTGKDIFFQFGMYNPNTKSGYELIAHEVTHVVQQASMQVKPGIDADSSLETAAQDKGKELATKFDPNTKSSTAISALSNTQSPSSSSGFSNLQRMPYLSLALQDSKLAFQRTPASSLKVVQREPKPATPSTEKKEEKGTKLNLRGAAFNEKNPVNLRSTMDTANSSNIVQKLPFGTTFLITEQLGTWYKIKLDTGATGFVALENISVAPDPNATFYKIKSGDNAIDIAGQHYQAKTGLDLRFYVGVLAKLNPKSITMPENIDWSRDDSVMAWKKANPLKNHFIWIPSQAYAASLKGQVNNGRLQDHPLEAAAEIGKGIVEKTIKELGGDEVIAQLKLIGQNVQLIWDDPGKFMSNLKTSFEQGFGNFQNNFGKHLEKGVMDWLQSALGANFDIPKTADTAGLLSVGLQIAGLDYNRNLRPMLASSLPAGGLTQLEGSGGVLQDVLKTGSLTPVLGLVQSKGQSLLSMAEGLPTTIMESLKSYAMKAIVTAGIKKMLTMLVPGGGLVQAAINIYHAFTFFMERAKQIGAFVSNLTSSFALIAKGDASALGKAAEKIEATLGSGLSLALGFLASAAGLTKIASSIKAALNKIQAPAQKVLNSIAAWITKMFSSLVKAVKPGAKSSTKPNSQATTQTASEVKEQYAIKLNGSSHTLFLEFGLKTPFVLDMQSKRDDLPKKIGRAIAVLLQTKQDTPLRQQMIDKLKILGKQAKNVRDGAKSYTKMDAEPESKRSSQRKTVKDAMSVLKQGIEEFGTTYHANDIDDNVQQLLDNPNMNTLAVLEKWGWTPKSVLGRRVYQKDSLILPTKITNGLSNLQLMQGYFIDKTGATKKGSKGFSPLSIDDKPINLHHLTQDEPGDMVEMDETQHSKFTAFLHGLKKSGQSFRNDKSLLKNYANFQSGYWLERAKDF